MDEQLAAELIRAVPRYLRLDDIARACKVRPRLLVHWLREGQQPNASTLYADFAAEFLRVDAQYQGTWIEHWQRGVVSGKRTDSIAAFMALRWPAQGGMSAQVEAPPETNIMALLQDPPAELLFMLRKSGIAKHLVDK